jgi:pimeloyl-ACP methyl ester carboxylesterase
MRPADVLYLHGFASSPQSTKATYLAERCQRHGLTLRAPDFNQPDFSTMTLTRMLDQLDGELPPVGGTSVTLVGSSLGGALAVLAAQRFGARVGHLVLLAPAVMFAKPGHHLLPPERLDEWRRLGAIPFFHYADRVERPLNYRFYEDSARYDPFTTVFTQPAIVFQGVRDRAVDPEIVKEFAAARRNVSLTLVEDDHSLVVSLPRIWDGMSRFLGLE